MFLFVYFPWTAKTATIWSICLLEYQELELSSTICPSMCQWNKELWCTPAKRCSAGGWLQQFPVQNLRDIPDCSTALEPLTQPLLMIKNPAPLQIYLPRWVRLTQPFSISHQAGQSRSITTFSQLSQSRGSSAQRALLWMKYRFSTYCTDNENHNRAACLPNFQTGKLKLQEKFLKNPFLL